MTMVTVLHNDTLETLSARTGVPACMLLRMNALTPDELYAGLRMSVPARNWCESRGACPLKERVAAVSVKTGVVAPGETLWDFSRRQGLTPRLIMLENDIDDADSVRPGDSLSLPDLPEKTTVYTPDAPEHIRDIAARFCVDTRELMWLNRLPAATIPYPGQQLLIPAV